MTLALSRAKALVLAFVVALVAAIGLAGNAHALIAEDDLPPSVIDTYKDASITVHKILRDSPATEQNLTGTEVKDPGSLGKPVSNVTFDLYEVTRGEGEDADVFDFGDTAQFKEARELVEKTPASTFATEDHQFDTMKTGADGTLKFEGLIPGLYVVAEKPSPEATVDGKKVILNPSDPFYVFVPMTNADRTGWNYDVHAYPKNSTSTVSKEVSDSQKNTGDAITYTLKSDVPVLSKDGELSTYKVIDQLDKRMTDINVTVKSSKDTEFTADTDYTLTTEDNKVVVTFTKDGLKKLAEEKKASNDTQVVTAITAKLPKIGDGEGIITNQASLIPNEGVHEGDIPSNKVETKLAKVHLTKVFKDGKATETSTSESAAAAAEGVSGNRSANIELVADDGDVPPPPEPEGGAPQPEGETPQPEGEIPPPPEGEGPPPEVAPPAEGEQPPAPETPPADGLTATFQVHRCSSHGDVYGGPLTINGQKDFTTGKNGELTIDAVQYTNFYNNKDQGENYLCLVETKTANGYELLPNPIPFQVTDDTVKNNVVELGKIENLKETGVTLPFTGGHGIGLLLGLGAVVVVGGVFLAVRSSRRTKAQG